MAQRPVVPKFGNWESEDNVPYTVYFEKARKGKTGGKMINPNDPQENSDIFPSPAPEPPSSARNAPEEPIRRKAHERRSSRDEGDFRQFSEAPPSNDNAGRRGNTGPTHQNRAGHGSGSGRPVRQSIGSEHSIDRSPLHPQHQARLVDKGGGSPAWESKQSYDSSHGTPGRSRMRPVSRGDESPEKGAAVPRFGDWDENNPASADNYTHIFNKVREEKITGSPMVSSASANPTNKRMPNDRGKNKSSCIPCFGK